MTLSNSRQQFLACETQSPEDIQYGRKGGIFVTTCICVSFVIFAVVVAALVGVIVYFITYFKLSQQSGTEFWEENDPFALESKPIADVRLPSYIVPSFYRLKLKANLENASFTGEVAITIKASKAVKEIVLHSKDLIIKDNAQLTEQIYEKLDTLHTSSKSKREVLIDQTNNTVQENNSTTTAVPVTTEQTNPVNVSTLNNTYVSSTASVGPATIGTQVTHSSVRNVKIISITAGSGDHLTLTLASALKPGSDYILELAFEGKITNSLTGFYMSSYTDSKQQVKYLGATQFEPTSARSAFPCFDEPAFKAKFEISIAHHTHIKALSNMKIATQELIKEEPNWQWTHFERSVKMSTYLVAYVLSDFESVETSYLSKDNITKSIRIWTRPELISKANYALTITPKILKYYEDVFGVPYILDKLDMIAIPDFGSGAMENWGLITFRETTLLYDESTVNPREKQNVAIDIAHELAHQWFGNLVTMQWWTDLWLNEGFATYIEYVGVNEIEPSWNIFETFSRDKMDLLRSDALKNTSPVSRIVVDASEISQKFDEISYNKGANLIRMLNHTISQELFHKGLLIYLNDWKLSNAEENDLWEAMTKATKSDAALMDLSVVDFMNSWTKQAGYPVVNVKRNYDTGDIIFEQKLFTSSKDPYQKVADQLWHIPISYTSMDAPRHEWMTKPKLWLKEKSLNTQVPVNQTQAIYVNVDSIGYYRVNYDQKNWELLSTALKSGHVDSPIAKAQLIDDAFNLAKTSQLNYSYALGLTTYLINGTDSKIVWDLLLHNMAFLKFNLQSTSGFIYFQDYIKKILSKQLQTLNYGLDPPKDDNEAFLIENLLSWECFVESDRCIKWAQTQFDSWMNSPDINKNPIPNYLRSIVYAVGLKYGGRREFDFLWNAFQNSTEPDVKSIIINSLSNTREESLIAMLLEKSLTEIPKQYAVAVWSLQPPLGTWIGQNYLADNFDQVYEKFTQMDPFMFPALLNGIFGYSSTNEELHRLKTLATKHKEKLMPMSQTLQKLIDASKLKIDWRQQHAANINRWFKDQVSGFPIPNKIEIDNPAPISIPTNISTVPEIGPNVNATANLTVPSDST